MRVSLFVRGGPIGSWFLGLRGLRIVGLSLGSVWLLISIGGVGTDQ